MNKKALLSLLAAVPSCAWAQTWDCRTFFGLGDVAVTVTKAENANTGQVSLPGTDVKHSARYAVGGLERLWTFGSADGRSPAFAFGIQPSGEGIYYVRGSASAAEWTPQDTYTCEDRRVQEQRAAEQAARDERARVAAEAERRALDAEFQQQLVVEAEANAARAAALLDQYVLMIENHVERYWERPLNARPGIECSVNVVQLPTGDVVSAKVAQCNGDDAVRRSIESAVVRSSPLPRAPSQDVFSRSLTLTFAPDE